MKSNQRKLTGLLVLALNGAAWACPMCKDSLGGSDTQGAGGLPSGFNTSIEIMLVGFLAAVTIVGWVIWKGIRGTL